MFVLVPKGNILNKTDYSVGEVFASPVSAFDDHEELNFEVDVVKAVVEYLYTDSLLGSVCLPRVTMLASNVGSG